MQQQAMQLEQMRVQIQGGKVKGDQKIAKEKVDLDSAVKSDSQRLDEQEFAWSKRMDLAEYRLESVQNRPVDLR